MDVATKRCSQCQGETFTERLVSIKYESHHPLVYKPVIWESKKRPRTCKACLDPMKIAILQYAHMRKLGDIPEGFAWEKAYVKFQNGKVAECERIFLDEE